MKQTIAHDIKGSVLLWLDHLLISEGQGFANWTGTFTSAGQTNKNGLYGQITPPRQWVYDSSVSGAVIPTGFYNNSVLTGRSNSLFLDFDHGQLLSTSKLNTVSGVVSYKEINVYTSNQTEEFLLFDRTYPGNSINFPPYTGFSAGDRTAPLIFVKQNAPRNKILSFERLSETITPIRLILVCTNEWQFQSICSLISDKKEKNIPLFMGSEMPINQFGDLKTGYFNYDNSVKQIQPDGNRLCQIKDVRISTFTDQVNFLINPIAVAGFVDIDLANYRYI